MGRIGNRATDSTLVVMDPQVVAMGAHGALDRPGLLKPPRERMTNGRQSKSGHRVDGKAAAQIGERRRVVLVNNMTNQNGRILVTVVVEIQVKRGPRQIREAGPNPAHRHGIKEHTCRSKEVPLRMAPRTHGPKRERRELEASLSPL